MGITTRVITETLTEGTCDLCKKPVGDDAKVGTLVLKGLKQRGRPTSAAVAFHSDCAARITESAAKPAAAAKRTRASSGNGRRKRSR